MPENHHRCFKSEPDQRKPHAIEEGKSSKVLFPSIVVSSKLGKAKVGHESAQSQDYEGPLEKH
jgi:hypothetical protein